MLFMFSYPGVPCIFYGDEVGLSGAHDPECRKSFPWDDSHWNHDLLNYTKAVIALRKEHPSLRRGSYHRLHAEDNLFVFGRKLEAEKLVIVLNASNSSKKATFSIEELSPAGQSPATIFGPDSRIRKDNQGLHMEVPARGGAVVRV
jgi:glycosidase